MSSKRVWCLWLMMGCQGLTPYEESSEPRDCTSPPTFYLDQDGDGFGTLSRQMASCTAPEGYVLDHSDCDDTDPMVNPEAEEVCDAESVDENCNEYVNEADSTLNQSSRIQYFPDEDTDGFGVSEDPVWACSNPSKPSMQYVEQGGDCNDQNSDIHPGAIEICDVWDTDEDCDGLIDDEDPSVERTSPLLLVPDKDRDGFGDMDASPQSFCDMPAEEGWSADPRDCDDTLDSVNPGHREQVDELDNDCDGLIDEQGVRDADLQWTGTAGSASLGEQVAWLGDVNADGYADYGFASYETGVFIEYGSNKKGWDVTVDSSSQSIPYRGMSLVGAAGDLDGDAVDDFYVVNSTGVHLFWGDRGGHSIGRIGDADVYFGMKNMESVETAGDLDGDGYDELLMGVPLAYYGLYEVCSVVILAGGEKRIFSSGPIDWDVPRYLGLRDLECGAAVSGAGDTDGDGYEDILFGSPGEGAYGSASWVSGSNVEDAITSTADVDALLMGDQHPGGAGSALAGLGDVDGDGYDDFIVGTDTANRAYLYFGQPSGMEDGSLKDASVVFSGENTNDMAGHVVSTAGDTNGDGFADVLIGAPRAKNHDAKRAGSSYLFLGGSGISGSWTLGGADWSIGGEKYLDDAGAALAGGGDVNADGYDDFIIGAPGQDGTAKNAGAAYLVFGRVGL